MDDMPMTSQGLDVQVEWHAVRPTYDPMKRETALALLGGTPARAARTLGCRAVTVYRWPDPLPRHVADRVLACWLRLSVRDRMSRGEPVDPVELDAVDL